MAKRVSLKGKGAELFFGELTPEPSPVADATSAAPESGQPTAPRTASSAPSAPAAPTTEAPEADAPEPAAAAPVRADTPGAQPNGLHATDSAGDRASTLASTMPAWPAIADASVVEAIRKTVKEPGKEVSFVRLTPAEKGQLADVVYTYKRQGVRTSETEVNRIAVNYLLIDYFEHGEQSILAKVMAALRA